MDTPVDDVTEVNVEIAAIWLKPAGEGAPFQLPLTETPITIDLLAHTQENAAILVEDALVAPGSYEWLAMDVNASIDGVPDSYVMTDHGTQVEIFVPSSRVRLVSGFEVQPNEALELLFDWDLRKGLVYPPGLQAFLLKPAFRVIGVTEYGALRGTVPVTTVSDATNDCNADVPADEQNFDVGNVVYVFTGHDIEPDDIDAIVGDDAEPMATITAVLNAASTHYEYRSLLPFGEYTIAFTCQAGNDDSEDDNTDSATAPVAFFADTFNVTISPNDLDVQIDF
jgi:hypothetical protein